MILLPASALTGLSRTQLEAVLAHELAHVRRHDYLVNLLQTLVETLLFYHPAVWWLGARIREEREHCCDDLAVAACGSAPLYAEALLSMEELRRSPELALAFSRGSLVGRIERLLAPRTPGSEFFPRWLAGLSAVGIVSLFAASSSLAEAARSSQREEVKQGERTGRAAAPDVPTGAGDVHLCPDAAQPLSARSEWARRAATEQRYREYWVGHAIAPNPSFPGGMLMGRFDHTGGLVLGDGESTITLSGGLMTSNADELDLPGVPLAPLVNAAGDDIAVLYLWSGTSSRAAIRRVHVATARLKVDLEGLPVLWLGNASDRDSVQEALGLMDRAPDDELRGDFVGVVGVHADSSLVVPELTRILDAKGLKDELRGDAAEWLARHPGMDALRALDAAARGDRSEEVRAEAAEAVAEMKYAPAFDALVALTRELPDPRARAEAVEGLGQRSEPAAVSALLDLASGDPDEDVQREAVETLGDVPDGGGVDALSALARSHPSVEVRREAIETYGECAPADEALALLQELAQRDPDSEARCEAVETLGELHDERVIGILSALVEQSDSVDVQREAVETLGKTVEGAEVVPLLERIARTHRNVVVQREAVETLGDVHEDGDRVPDILAGIAADHPFEEVRSEAVETLGDCPPPDRAIPLLERLLESERSTRVRKEIRETIEELRITEELDEVRASSPRRGRTPR
jgi:HEAT repeat protein